MKAITLRQPYASLVATGVKTIETRTWSTKYRGPIAIHAGLTKEGLDAPWGPLVEGSRVPGVLRGDVAPLPLGMVVATARLADVARIVDDIPRPEDWTGSFSMMTVTPWPILTTWRGFGSADGRGFAREGHYGDFTVGNYAWLLADIVRLDKPIPTKGRQGLWNWEPS